MLLSVKVTELKERREKKNLSMHQLSLNAGLGGNAIMRIESGKSKVHHLRAKAIAEALGCELYDVFEAPEKCQRGA